MNDETAVEQIDRDAAADYCVSCGAGFVAHIRDGIEDDSGLVQAFARHRLAATKPIRDEEREAIRREALEDAARVAEEYSAEMDKPYRDLVHMPPAQQARYEGHKYAGQNIAAAIRSLSPDDPLPVLKGEL